MSKIRVYELAKELGRDNKEIINCLTANGIEVKSPTELLNAESEVEFLHADDGSISLLIKNVIL